MLTRQRDRIKAIQNARYAEEAKQLVEAEAKRKADDRKARLEAALKKTDPSAPKPAGAPKIAARNTFC